MTSMTRRWRGWVYALVAQTGVCEVMVFLALVLADKYEVQAGYATGFVLGTILTFGSIGVFSTLIRGWGPYQEEKKWSGPEEGERDCGCGGGGSSA